MLKVDCIGLKSGCRRLLSLLEVLGGNSLSWLFSYFQRLLPSSKSSVTILSDLSSDTDPQSPASTSKDLVITLVVVVQLLSRVRLSATPWTAVYQASLSFTISRSLLKLVFIESVMPSNHLIFCHLLLLLHSVFPSIRVFSSEWVLSSTWPKYWSFRFSVSPSSEYSGLISFRIAWFDLLAVQGTTKSLLQH